MNKRITDLSSTAGYVGWVCTVAGTPGSSAGTWKGFGVVA